MLSSESVQNTTRKSVGDSALPPISVGTLCSIMGVDSSSVGEIVSIMSEMFLGMLKAIVPAMDLLIKHLV